MRWPPCCTETHNGHPRVLKNARGWMLLEMLLVMPMILLLAGILIIFLGNSMRIFNQLSLMEERQNYARTAMQAIIDDIAGARQVTICNNGQGLELSYPDGHSRKYYLSGKQIYFISQGSAIPLTEDTSLLVFSPLSSRVIRAEIIQGCGKDAYRLVSACALQTQLP